ncbi:hypothetical protein ccbrp13_21360 [Ktedonobacteria bacterium brp13]|nr:hypothetical protein ccbrp13_21360 [Ktedonobacteria bacterium brp13]
MRCPVCQTAPCQVLEGDLAHNAAWLFSDEAEQVLTSGEWCSLFEHAAAQIREPEVSAEKVMRKRNSPDTMHKQSQHTPILPSKETEEFWIWVHCPRLSEPSYDAEKVGKWLVFVPVAQVDAAWAKIKEAVEQGRLGGTAKVATAKKSPREVNSAERVICVYTDDWTDEYEVRRVHAELYDLGCTWPMSYKTDKDTLAGVYRHTGYTRVGVYRFGPRDAFDFKAGNYVFLKERTEEQMTSHSPLRLTIELVPQPCWYSNMRKVVPRSTWDTLRRQVYAQYNHHCGICQARERLHCHEIWHYDDDQHVQTLHGFIALCEWCHHVKHLGLAGILAGEGKLDYDRVVAHFLAVNACRLEDFEEHRQQEFVQWRARNRYEWRTDLGKYISLVPQGEDEQRLF